MIKRFKLYIIHNQLIEAKGFHDKTRINLLFNLAFSVLILGLIASIISLIFETYPILIPAFGNVILATITLVLLKFSNFQFAATIYFSALFLLLFGNLIFNDGTMHIGSPFWVMLLNVLVIYILGKAWGIFYLTISMLGFSYYIIFVFPTTIEITRDLPTATYYSAVYETVFVLIILGYIISIILKASRDSDELHKEQKTALIHQNETITQRNEEKTVLLKEIHHRVKNNLQVIISLMRLQMQDLKNEEAIEKFNDTINRVIAISMIHEKIYQTESLSQVDINKYFYDLSEDLLASFETNYKVKLIYQFDVDKIGLKTIIPLALIFNELFSNTLKHAFKNIKNPSITLSLSKVDEHFFLLKYKDNGKWIEPKEVNSFGLDLIETLTNQLDGTMSFEEEPETSYAFKFPQLNF